MLKYEKESREVTSKDRKTQAQIGDHVLRNRKRTWQRAAQNFQSWAIFVVSRTLTAWYVYGHKNEAKHRRPSVSGPRWTRKRYPRILFEEMGTYHLHNKSNTGTTLQGPRRPLLIATMQLINSRTSVSKLYVTTVMVQLWDKIILTSKQWHLHAAILPPPPPPLQLLPFHACQRHYLKIRYQDMTQHSQIVGTPTSSKFVFQIYGAHVRKHDNSSNRNINMILCIEPTINYL